MSKKITTEIFKERLNEALGDEYTCLGEYVSKGTPIRVKHKCGYEFTIIPHNLKTNVEHNNLTYQCPYCNPDKIRKYTAKDVEKIFVEYGYNENEYSVIEYVSNKKKMKVRHNTCGLEFEISLSNFKHAHHLCPNCDSGFMSDEYANKRLSIDELKECLKHKNPDYELVSKYRTNRDNGLIFRHKTCGTEFKAKAYLANREHQLVCVDCRLKEKNPDYELISDYTEAKDSKLIFKHKLCGTEFEVKSYLANRDHRIICPTCKHRSTYENKIRCFLQSCNIKFEEQKTFDDCIDIKPLRYDFYLPTYNILIDYDGEYHDFKYKKNQDLEGQKKRDNIKTEYCKTNKIPLIRISYKEKAQWKRCLINRLISINKIFKTIFESSTTIESIDNEKNVIE